MISDMSAKDPTAFRCDFFDIFVLNVCRVVFGTDIWKDDIVGILASMVSLCYFGNSLLKMGMFVLSLITMGMFDPSLSSVLW